MISFPNCSQDQKPVSYNLVSQPATFISPPSRVMEDVSQGMQIIGRVYPNERTCCVEVCCCFFMILTTDLLDLLGLV